MMSKSKSKELSRAKAQRRKAYEFEPRLSLRLCAFARENSSNTSLLSALMLTTGCRRDMQDQPKIKPLRGATFFRDGLGSRQPIQGTIPRGYLRSDTEFFTGKKTGAPGATATPAQQQISRRSTARRPTLTLTTSILFRCRSPRRSYSAAASVTTSSVPRVTV